MPEQFVFGADEELDPLPLLRRIDEAKQALLRLQSVEQGADALQILDGGHIVEQPRLPSNDQRTVGAVPTPNREPALYHGAGQRVERGPVLLHLARDIGPDRKSTRLNSSH